MTEKGPDMPKPPDKGSGARISEDLPSVDKKLAQSFGWDGTERRQHPRFRVRWGGVLDRTSSDFPMSAEVRLSDVSEGGCCIFFRRQSQGPDPGIFFASAGPLSLKMFSPSGMLISLVEVRWYMPIEEDAYAAGLQFLSMSSRDRSILHAAIQELGRA